MRRFFMLALSVCALSFANAQFTIAPSDTFIYSGALHDSLDNPELTGTINYGGSGTDTFHWQVTSLNMPASWQMSVCDINNCYYFDLPLVNEVYSFEVTPSARPTLIFGVSPSCLAGNGNLSVNVWLASDSAATAKTLYFSSTFTGVCGGTSAISEVSANNVRIYPSAFQSHITIENGEAKVSEVKMYNALGCLVKEIKTLNGNSTNLETADLASGVYIVRVETTKGSFVQRVVKE